VQESIQFRILIEEREQRSARVSKSVALIGTELAYYFGQRRSDMSGIIQIVSGLVIGCAGFHLIAEHPIQGICALFLAGFLVMIGFEKKLAERSREIRH
jgi:hypothetical protein